MSYAALIIETESLDLYDAIKSFKYNLPFYWTIVLVHGPNNQHEAIHLKNTFNIEILLVSNKTDEKVNYDDIILNPSLWKQIKEEHVLVLNIRSAISNYFFDNITSYLKYDYVGIPMNRSGVSLRRTSVMQKILPQEETYPEEFVVCKAITEINGKICPYTKAQEFCTTTSYFEKSLIISEPWLYLNPYELTLLKNQDPAFSLLLDRFNIIPHWTIVRILNFIINLHSYKSFLQLGLDEPRDIFYKIQCFEKNSTLEEKNMF